MAERKCLFLWWAFGRLSAAKLVASKKGREVEDGMRKISAEISMDEGDEWGHRSKHKMRVAVSSGIFLTGQTERAILDSFWRADFVKTSHIDFCWTGVRIFAVLYVSKCLQISFIYPVIYIFLDTFKYSNLTLLCTNSLI